jgi:hypothetical protein
MSVWLVQCLCGPARHCLLAAADEADTPDLAEATLRTALAHLLTAQVLNP